MDQVLDELGIENKRGEQLKQMRKDSQSQRWWEAPIAELSPTQLADLKVSLQELKIQVTQQVEKVMIQSSAPQYFPGNSSTEGIPRFDPTNTGFNLANNNMMPPFPPPPMIQSSTHLQEFPGSSSTGGIHQSDPDHYLGFNPGNMNMMAPPHMIQPSAPPQYFAGSSNNGGILPLDPIPNNTNFDPSNMNMMHPPPSPHNQPQQPFQPLHFPSPQHSYPGFHPGVNHRFY